MERGGERQFESTLHCLRGEFLVAEIYAWFTEGFDTPDLRDAKALLATTDQGDRRAASD